MKILLPRKSFSSKSKIKHQSQVVTNEPLQSTSPFNLTNKEHCACDGACPRCEVIQPKLKTGPSIAGLEQEADHLADNHSMAIIKHGINHANIRTDHQAANATEALNARAFTLGNDIYFNQGEFNPHTHAGRKLLAHELVHVGQQKNISSSQQLVQRKKKKAPTERQLLNAWLYYWRQWKKKKTKNPNFSMDCVRGALKVVGRLGGSRNLSKTVVFHGKPYSRKASKQEGKEALSRFKSGHKDFIVNEHLIVWDRTVNTGIVFRMFPLKPGMLIYTSEKYTNRWNYRHMCMYTGQGKKLDSINITKPKPKPFKPVWGSGPTQFFVVLKVYDPFKNARTKAMGLFGMLKWVFSNINLVWKVVPKWMKRLLGK